MMSSDKTTTKPKVTEQTRAKQRPKRDSMHRQGPLVFKKIPGFRTRMVNDSEDKIDQRREEGWEIVMGDEYYAGDTLTRTPEQLASPVRRIVNRGADNSATHGVLMKIPNEWYDEIKEEDHAKWMKKLEDIDKPKEDEDQYAPKSVK